MLATLITLSGVITLVLGVTPIYYPRCSATG